MKKYLSSLLIAPLALGSLVFSAIAPLSAQAQSATPPCYTFTGNLGEGKMLNPETAAALAQDLSAQGFWSAGTPITTYNDAVASAVSGFQEKYAAQILTPNDLSYGTGFVGALTRAELNSLYGCSATPASSTSSSSSPTQMPTLPPPQPSQAPQPPTMSQCPTGSCVLPTQSTPTLTQSLPTQTPPTQISAAGVNTVNHAENPDTARGLIWVYWPNLGPGYTYTVSASPSYTGSVETTSGTDAGDGQLGVNMGCWGFDNDVCYSGGGPFPTNGPYTFTVTATNSNGQTTTIGTSNPQVVTNDGSYTVSQTCGNTCQQEYPQTMPTAPATQTTMVCPAGYVCTPINQVSQPVCPAGYTCTPIVSNSINNPASQSQQNLPPIAATSTAPSLTVTSPNGGIYAWNSQIPIRWNASAFAGSTVKIEIMNTNGLIPDLMLTSTAPNTGSYSWTIPQGAYPAGGNYQILVIDGANLNNSAESAAFNISSQLPDLSPTLPAPYSTTQS